MALLFYGGTRRCRPTNSTELFRLSRKIVGVDAHIGPPQQTCNSSRADVGIRPCKYFSLRIKRDRLFQGGPSGWDIGKLP